MRARRAEEELGWQPVPDVPRHFRRILDRADRELDRCVVAGDRGALVPLIETLDRVVSDPRFAASLITFRRAILNRAGIAHNWLGTAEQNETELAKAAELFAAGLELVTAGSVEQTRLDCNVAITLLNLYRGTGDPAYLARSIDHATRGVAHAEDNTRLAALCHDMLAEALRADFRASGDVSVLTKAIEHAERAASADSSLDIPSTLANLLFVRHQIYGSIDDLNRAIDVLRRVLDERGGSSVFPAKEKGLGGTLGAMLRSRYLRTAESADLDEAFRLLTDAVNEDPADQNHLSNLGDVQLTRYHEHGDRADLFAAIDSHQKALDLAPDGDWQLAALHNGVGNTLSVAAQATAANDLGEQAAGHYRTALRMTPENAPERASREYNLARVLHTRTHSEGINDRGLVTEAVDAYRDAVRHGLNTSLEWALFAAMHWGAWAVERRNWGEACTAYEGALEASQRLFRTQLLREDKEAWLIESQGLPAAAAYAMFRAGRIEDAAVALEAGRGLLLSEVLERDRAELHQLIETGHRELVERYQMATTALEEMMRSGAEPRLLRDQRAAIDQAIEEIHAIAGYERFLLSPTIGDIRRAIPPNSVVIYLAATQPAGLAVAVYPNGNIEAIELPRVTAAAVRQRADALIDARRNQSTREGRWDGTLDAITRWAWTAIFAPMRHIIGVTEQKIIMVPSGLLTMLPLHAAWTPATNSPSGRHYLLDENVATYTPTVRSLEVTGRTAAQTTPKRLTVVCDPQPTTRPPIGYARPETAWARQWFSATEVLETTQANHTAVIAALTSTHVYHFICHGHARPDHPLDSSLILAEDKELTLREVLALRLSKAGTQPAPRLAVLSACDTDQPGTTLPDEIISLPTGLIQAGIAGVVATQWAIRSDAACLLMARFYQLWQAEGQHPTTALRAAQRWLRDTTNAEKIRDLTSAITPTAGEDAVSLIRSLRLREPDERSYLHPSDWAAFSYHGT